MYKLSLEHRYESRSVFSYVHVLISDLESQLQASIWSAAQLISTYLKQSGGYLYHMGVFIQMEHQSFI